MRPTSAEVLECYNVVVVDFIYRSEEYCLKKTFTRWPLTAGSVRCRQIFENDHVPEADTLRADIGLSSGLCAGKTLVHVG